MVVHPRLIGVLLRGRSSWKALAETDYFVLQHHPRQVRMPPFRIITRGFPHYRVAEGDQLELLQDELEYLTIMARQAIVGKVTSKKISAWLKASFQRQSVLALASPEIHLLDPEHAHEQFEQYEDEEEEEEEEEDLDDLDELDVDDEIEAEVDDVDEDESDNQHFTDDQAIPQDGNTATTTTITTKAQKNKSVVDTLHQHHIMGTTTDATTSLGIRPLKRSSSLENVGGSSSTLSPHRIPLHHRHHLHHITHPPSSHTLQRPASSASIHLPPSSGSISNVLQSHARTSSPEPMLDPIPRPHSAFSLRQYTLPGELDIDQVAPSSQYRRQYPRLHSSSLPTPDASPGEMSDDSLLDDIALLGNDELDQARSIRSVQPAGTYGPLYHHQHRHPLSTAAPSVLGAGGEPLPMSTWTWWTGSPFVDALVNWIEGPEHVTRAKTNEKDKPNPIMDIPLQFIALLTYPEPDPKTGNKMTLSMVRETAFVKQRRRTLLILTVYTLLVRYCSFDFFLVLLFASNCGMLFLMKNSGRMNVNMAKRAVRQRVGWARQWAGSIFRRGNNSNTANSVNSNSPGQPSGQQQFAQASSMTYQTSSTALASSGASTSNGAGSAGNSLQGLDSSTLLQDQEPATSSPPIKRKGLFARKMGLGGSSSNSNSNNASQTMLHDGASTMTGASSTTSTKRRFFKRGSQPRASPPVITPSPASVTPMGLSSAASLHQSTAGMKSTLSNSSKAYLSTTTTSTPTPPLRSQTLNVTPSSSSTSTTNLPPNRPFSPKSSGQMSVAAASTPVPPSSSTPASTTSNGTATVVRKTPAPTTPSTTSTSIMTGGLVSAAGVPTRPASSLSSPMPIPIPVNLIATTTATTGSSITSKDSVIDPSAATTSLAWMGYSSSMPTVLPSGMMPAPAPRPSISSSIVDGVSNSSSGSSSSGSSIKSALVAPHSPSTTAAPSTPPPGSSNGDSHNRKAGPEEALLFGTSSPTPPASSSSVSSKSSSMSSPASNDGSSAVAYSVRFGPALVADGLMDSVSSAHADGMEGF